MPSLQSQKCIAILALLGNVTVIYFGVTSNRWSYVGTDDLILAQNNNIQSDDIDIDGLILDLQNNTLQQLENTPLIMMQNCWFYLFNKLFVATKLHHIFSKQYDENVNTYTDCVAAADNMAILLKTTSNSLQITTDFNYHDLIALRRIIMLFQNIYIDIAESDHDYDYVAELEPEYANILTLIANMEREYIFTYRNNYTIFNIHQPRSAGTFICRSFKKAKKRQSTFSLKAQKYQRKIRPYPMQKRNCNAGDGDAFVRYGNPAAKTCDEQYNMHNNTMIAREAPLYPNKNKNNIKHPLLCNKFVYVMTLRSPIERIFSWAKSHTQFEMRTLTENNSRWIGLRNKFDLPKLLPNFYFSLFNFTVNAAGNNVVDIIGGDKEKKTQIRIRERNEWIRPYSSNAVTKWIGYEWEEDDIVHTGMSGFNPLKSLLMPTDQINENDVHFYNAIKLLLKIDYVLNFASYEKDSSAVHAIKFANKTFENIIAGPTKMSDTNSMWHVFGKHMKYHFNISQSIDIFSFGVGKQNIWQTDWKARDRYTQYVTQNDWKTLYEQNYFDFRLYSLSKMIEKVDLMYYNQIYIIN